MSKENIKVLSLSDNVIAHIARLLQVSMLTGTDIVDHMRMIRLNENNADTDTESELVLDAEYSDIFDGTLDKMLKNVDQQEQ
tara:strand:- start:868 stop:1113 length:246 start_codon:yes stop_codon:yes gene_type:complete